MVVYFIILLHNLLYYINTTCELCLNYYIKKESSGEPAEIWIPRSIHKTFKNGKTLRERGLAKSLAFELLIYCSLTNSPKLSGLDSNHALAMILWARSLS